MESMESKAIPDNIIEYILQHVEVKDLPCCRLVCKQWNLEALKQIKHRKIITIRIPLDRAATRTEDDLDLITKTADAASARAKFHKLVSDEENGTIIRFTNFKIKVDNRPTDELLCNKFWTKFAPFIKTLNLKLKFLEIYLPTIGPIFLPLFTLEGLDQLKHLQLNCEGSYFPRFEDFSQQITQKLKLVDLTIKIRWLEPSEKYFGNTSYLNKLLLASINLNKLDIEIDFCKEWTKEQRIEFIKLLVEACTVTSATLRRLRLNLFSTDDIRFPDKPRNRYCEAEQTEVDFTPWLNSRQKFHLTFLQLENICSTNNSMYKFVDSQNGSLQQLVINNAILLPTMENLHTLRIPFYDGTDESISQMKVSTHFPKLEYLGFVTQNLLVEEGARTFLLDSDSQTHLKSLDLEIVRCGAYAADILNGVAGLEKLSLGGPTELSLTTLWKSYLWRSLTVLELRVYDDDVDLNPFLNGFHPSDCDKINSAMNKLSQDKFTLDFINLDYFKSCSEKTDFGNKNIANFKNLQRVSITCFSSFKFGVSQLTFLFMLQTLKQLNAMSLSCLQGHRRGLSQIIKELPPTFTLKVDSVTQLKTHQMRL